MSDILESQKPPRTYDEAALGRDGTADEVAKLIAFLLSDDGKITSSQLLAQELTEYQQVSSQGLSTPSTEA